MNNPLRILETLDGFLSEKIELTLYGRAAIALGYCPDKPFTVTLDIDLIIPEVELSSIDVNDDFWNAVEKTNQTLTSEGLYLTHIFVDRQLILSSNWVENRIYIPQTTLKRIHVYRPSTQDLILTKMMRMDPQDREDIKFLARQISCTRNEWVDIFNQARLPDVIEIQEALFMNKSWFLDEVIQ